MENKFSTTDFYTAVILYYFNFPLVQIEINESAKWNQGIFIFDDTPELQSIVTDFRQRKLAVEPNKFASIVKDLKQTVFSLQGQFNGQTRDIIVPRS